MKRLFAVAALALAMASSPAFASKNIYTQCGIGALIFQNTGWAAAISNIIWDLGTTASTTTTSSEDQCAGKGASVAKFIHETYASVEEELVIGEGAHLTAMLDIVGCDESARPAIISDVRTAFAKSLGEPSFADRTQVQKSEALFLSVMGNVQTKHALHCG